MSERLTVDCSNDPENLAWQSDALCAQTGPEIQFPESRASDKVAKAVCARCMVRLPCLEYALLKGEKFGVWGGLNEKEREQLLEQRQAQANE